MECFLFCVCSVMIITITTDCGCACAWSDVWAGIIPLIPPAVTRYSDRDKTPGTKHAGIAEMMS